MSATYLIWSNEHRAWWRQGRWGYTPDIADAGHYDRAEAMAICRQAQDGRGFDKNPNEIAIPVADAIEQFAAWGVGGPAKPPAVAQRRISFVPGDQAPAEVNLIVALQMKCCLPGAKLISTGQRDQGGKWVLPIDHDVEILGWMVAPAFPEILAPQGGQQ